MKIDSHQHFWIFDEIRDSWMTDDMSVIKHNFLPTQLQPILEANNIDGCIAVQATQSSEETLFLLKLAKENTFIKGIVGWVNLQADDIEQQLAGYAKEPLIKGFRHILQAEPNDAFMLGEKFMHGISLLHKYNFSYDILIYPKHLPYAKQLVASFPQQRFVIDHMAKPNIKAHEITQWAIDIKEIATLKNVYCKISGMVTEADWHNHNYQDFIPYIDVVIRAFGKNRIMFGSDWPVCLLAANYEKMLEITQHFFSRVSEEDKNLFFGNNAKTFYKL